MLLEGQRWTMVNLLGCGALYRWWWWWWESWSISIGRMSISGKLQKVVIETMGLKYTAEVDKWVSYTCFIFYFFFWGGFFYTVEAWVLIWYKQWIYLSCIVQLSIWMAFSYVRVWLRGPFTGFINPKRKRRIMIGKGFEESEENKWRGYDSVIYIYKCGSHSCNYNQIIIVH